MADGLLVAAHARPIRPDLRDHVVLAGALGLAFGSTDPIADGADDVADLSAAITARWPDVRSYTAAEIVAGPRPFGFKLPAWRRLWADEARLNWPNWMHDLTAPGGPATPAASAEALELAKRIASYIGGVTR